MDHYRRASHTKFDIKLHFVWITKYRQPLLTGSMSIRARDLIRQICTELEVEIIKGHVSKDHVHLCVSCPPHVSSSYLMQRVKGRTSQKLTSEFSADGGTRRLQAACKIQFQEIKTPQVFVFTRLTAIKNTPHWVRTSNLRFRRLGSAHVSKYRL
jgi:Transposase and inactivated derivatives